MGGHLQLEVAPQPQAGVHMYLRRYFSMVAGLLPSRAVHVRSI